MLSPNALTHEHKRKLRWLVAVSSLPLLGVVTAFGIIPQSQLDPAGGKTVVEEIALPRIATQTQPTTFWRSETTRRGDTVAELLRRLNVEDESASDFLRNSPQTAAFRQLGPGVALQAETGEDGSLLALRFTARDGTQTVIEKKDSGFKVTSLPAQLEQRIFMRTGVIESSLFAATDAAGLPEAAANQMADIFGGDIDFHRDLRKGDKFTVVYEVTYSNGEPVRAGRTLAAEFVNQGRSFRAVYFQPDNGRGGYYTPEGKSLRKSFLRSPLEFSRISSGFSSGRLHPVLNTIRAHKGVDYAAAIGTKVRVTGDGVVALAGVQRGYGNVVVINHAGGRSTVYGHLSRFAPGLRQGQRVLQGETIGFVGMTGLATGPHLHYEFKINGEHRDPLRVALPDAAPITAAQKAAFDAAAANLNARLSLVRNTNYSSLD